MLQKAEVKDLVVQTPINVAKVFTPEGMNGLLQDIETQVKAHVPVIDTDEGRKNIISLAYKVSQSKSLIVKTGDREVEEAKKKVKAMGDLLKTAKTFLDDLRDETRAPVTEWEAEQQRIADEEAEKERLKTEKRVDDLMAVDCVMPFLELAIMTDDEFQCFLGDKTYEFEDLQKEKAEAEVAEKARLAKEAADRKAEDARLAKQKEEQDAFAAALKEQSDKLDAQQKAIDDEKDRIAKAESDKKAAEEAEAQAAKDAEELAKHQAKEAEEAEERAKAEAARQEALKPDKEKLIQWIGSFRATCDPELKSNEAKEILRITQEYIGRILIGALTQVEEL